MSIVQRIQAHLANPPLSEDGEPWDTKLLPPFNAQEIASIERELGYALPEETRSLLEFCRGFDGGALETFELWGPEADYLYPVILRGRFRALAQDGYGNFWFYWNRAGTVDLGPIYYYQHEGPMLFVQCSSILEFVDEWLRFMRPPYQSLIDDVHEFRIKPIQELNKDLVSRETALASGDEVLRELAEPLEAGAMIYDFRNRKLGDGVDLKQLDVLAMHPKWPILAVRPRATLLGKLKGMLTGKAK
ncbi:SMI1/KNR4 family protein [Roseimicrobium sp. ORNL1]|uniref:SMI1/KNR4 family protein n=1 Tax=Roseimicrobium sp. ORNL1 TaxID=2711231 RepID=UPI0013E18A3B|nr:SMI1/KNR4 family protein [Roseimicrobium sp. ORNL1]QIF03549.1 SMI1/KNR4 family protein [Roseimicrobium sp. ORNL1]